MDNRHRRKADTASVEEALSPEGLKLILSYTAEDRRHGDAAQHDHRRKGDTQRQQARLVTGADDR